MKNKSVHILWDHSQLWGVMVFRAMRAFGVNCRLVNSKQIAQGGLMRKPPALLIVPGGSARKKAGALGPFGREQILRFVEFGGRYLGFCGGAGLALSHSDPADGLGLCPWQRMAYPERLYHLVSGHFLASGPHGAIELPVWWPGRFEEGGGQVEILARYEAPGRDLWLADLPLGEIPDAAWEKWSAAGLLDRGLDFRLGQPLVIAGSYGAGGYVLSYAHLETPASPAANAWLRHLLEQCGIEVEKERTAPQWRTGPQPVRGRGLRKNMEKARHKLWHLVCAAETAGFLFQRTPWLWGWRRGAPGMGCNHLLAYLDLLASLESTRQADSRWHEMETEFWRLFDEFINRAEAFFWNCRLEDTLRLPAGAAGHANDRDAIFGHPRDGGGLIGGILDFLEDLVFMNQEP